MKRKTKQPAGMVVVTPKILASRIVFHLGPGTILKPDVLDAISTITSELAQSLLQDGQIRIKNFGTLSVATFPYRVAMPHVQTGKLVETKATKYVKFHPHTSLLQLLSERRERFR